MFSQKNANTHSLKKKKGNVSEEISKYSRKAETLKGSSESVTLELRAYRTDSCWKPRGRGWVGEQCLLAPAKEPIWYGGHIGLQSHRSFQDILAITGSLT